MTNTELTLDQLQATSGGAAFMKLGDIKGEYRQQTPGDSKAQSYCTGYCFTQQSDIKADYRQEAPVVSLPEKLTSKSIPCYTEF